MLFYEFMVWMRSVVSVRGFPGVLILIRQCPENCWMQCLDHFWMQGGDPTFSKLIQMCLLFSIGTNAYGNVAYIKGKGLDRLGSHVNMR